MKNLILFIALLAITQSLFAQSSCIPNKIHLNAVARNADRSAVSSQSIDVQIEFFSGNPTQTSVPIYCELAINIKTNAVGEFGLDFGNPDYYCNPNVPLGNVDWTKCNSGNLYYRLSWRITGQQTLIPIATGQFTSVPYAFAARTAETVSLIPSVSVSYGSTWLSTSLTNTWVVPTMAPITVLTSGTYLLNATTGVFTNGNPFNAQARIANSLTNNTVVSFGIGALSQISTGVSAMYGSVSTVVSLTAGQVLRLEVFNSSTGDWKYGGDSGHPSYFNIVRLGN